VTRDVPANTVVAGNPAQVVKELDPTQPRYTRTDLYQDPHGAAAFYDRVDREVLSGNGLLRWLLSCVYPGSQRSG